MRGAFLLGIIVSAAGCFKPALEREVDIEPDMSEVADTEDDVSDILDTITPDVDTNTEDTDTEVEAVECQGATGQSCDDGDPCTRDDRCGHRGCEGIPYLCDDGLSCTEDRCDGAGGCTYPLANGACLIGGTCVAAGQVNADDPCRVCAGGQAWSPNDGGSCEDDDTTCTLGDTCEGFVCVGGPRPSDAATDWGIRPITPFVPSSAIVRNVGRAGPDDTLIAIDSTGPTTYESTTATEVLDGNSALLLRRTSRGLIRMVAYDGFNKAELAAFTVPTTMTSFSAVAVTLQGSGTYSTHAATIPLEYEEERQELVVLDGAGAPVWRATWHNEIDALAVDRSNGGLWLGGRAMSFDLDDVGGQLYTGDGAYVTRLGYAGAPNSWALGMRSAASGTRPGSVSLCESEAGLVIATSFVDSLLVYSPEEEPEQHAGPANYRASAFIWLENDVPADIQTPFRWVPQTASGFAPQLSIRSCESSGLVVFVQGKLMSGGREGGHYTIDVTEPESTVMRLDRSGTITWAVSLRDVATPPTSVAATPSGLIVPWHKMSVPGVIVDSVGERVELPLEMGTGLAWFDSAGRVIGNHPFSGHGGIFSATRLSNGTFVVGGAFDASVMDFQGADGPIVIEGTADITPFVVGLNTNRGLECTFP